MLFRDSRVYLLCLLQQSPLPHSLSSAPNFFNLRYKSVCHSPRQGRIFRMMNLYKTMIPIFMLLLAAVPGVRTSTDLVITDCGLKLCGEINVAGLKRTLEAAVLLWA